MGSQFLRFCDSFFGVKYRTKIFVKENNKDNGDTEVQKMEVVEERKEGEKERQFLLLENVQEDACSTRT